MFLNKKANHGRLILFLAIMFVSTFVFAVTLEFGLDLMGSSFTMEERTNDKFSNDFDVIAVYAFGTEDSSVDGGADNISIIGRLGRDSIEIPFSDIIVQLRAQNIKKSFEFTPDTSLNGNTYIYNYDHKGNKFKDGYINTGDVVNLNIQLPSGYSIPEDTYIIIDIFYTKKILMYP